MKNLSRKKVFGSILVLGIISCYNASWGIAADLDGTVNGGKVDITTGFYDAVFGKKDTDNVGVNTIDEYKKLPVAEAIGSNVEISESTINEAYGGIAGYYDDDRNYQQGGKANNNILNITNTKVKNGVIGGYAYSGINYRVNDVESMNNKVILDNIKILETNQLNNVIVVNPMATSGFNKNITVGGFATHSGASSHSAIAVGNTLEIYNSNINTVISGGIASGGSAGNGGFLPYGDGEGYVDAKIATNNNTVIIDKSVTGNEQEYKDIYGGYSGSVSVGNTVESSSNTIKIKNGSTIYGYVYGGVAYCSQNNTGNMNSNGSNVVADIHSNAVTIADSDVMGDVYGAYLYENGNRNIALKPEIDELISNLNNNKVEVRGNSKLSGSVYGADGYISNSDIKDGAEVIGNSVSFTQNSYIGDTDIQSAVFGGSAYSYASSTFKNTKRTSGNVYVTENTVTIDTTQTVYADIYGGYAKSEGGGVNDRTGKGNGHGNAGDATASKNTVN